MYFQSMLSGALIRIPDDLAIERLDGLTWERGENNRALTSVIQFREPIVVDRDTNAQSALAVHQEIGMEPALIQGEDGRYRVTHHDTVMTKWAYIHIVHGFVVADRLANRSFVIQIINNGLNQPVGAHNIHLDTARMTRDHANQWVRGFSDRLGRVDRGTVFGEAVEQDSIFGPELGRSRSKSVGWITNFFGEPTKVRVSPKGSVVLWSDVPEGLFLRFLRMRILPYVIALP